jgi:hypothetical protein
MPPGQAKNEGPSSCQSQALRAVHEPGRCAGDRARCVAPAATVSWVGALVDELPHRGDNRHQ